MRVRQGWSGEVKPNQWAKFSVELDEEDLGRLLRSFHPGLADVDTIARLGHLRAYQLLELEAEMLVTTKLVVRYGFDATAGRRKLDELFEQKMAILEPLVAEVADHA